MFGFNGRPVAASDQHLLGERGAQRHDHAAFDLLLERERVERPPDIVRGHVVGHLDRARDGVDLDLGGVGGPGGALPLLILDVDRTARGSARPRTGRPR